MTKLGKYISDLLGKKEGRIYFDPTIGDYRYEENDELVYGEEIPQSEKKEGSCGLVSRLKFRDALLIAESIVIDFSYII